MAEENANKKFIKLLIIDDSPEDADKAAKALQQAGYTLKHNRVDEPAAVEAALDAEQWDIIISEHRLQKTAADKVLQLANRNRTNIPVIVLAKAIGDEDILQSMQAGARDVVLKGQWARLSPVIERELKVAAEHHEIKATRDALQQMEGRYLKMVENAREAICYCHEGLHVDANPSYLSMFGYDDLEQLKIVPVLDMIDKQDQKRFKTCLRKPESLNGPEEFKAVNKEGKLFYVEMAVSKINIAGEECVQVGMTDISMRKILEEKLQRLRQCDGLTGLYNRCYFMQALGKTIHKTKTENIHTNLLGLELHNLKQLNDQLGHAACDRLLLTIAQHLRSQIGDKALLARLGGGQFGVLPAGETMDEARSLKDKIVTIVNGMKFTKGGERLDYDITLNLVTVDGSIEDKEILLSSIFKEIEKVETKAEPQPDIAEEMIDQKEEQAEIKPELSLEEDNSLQNVAADATNEQDEPALGSDDTEPEAMANEEETIDQSESEPEVVTEDDQGGPTVDWEKTVYEALEKDAMQVLFQPITNLHSDLAEYYECILYMDNGAGDQVATTEFMTAAIKSGLAIKLDRRLAQYSVDALAGLYKQGRQGAFFITLSPMAHTDDTLLAAIQQHLHAIRVPMDALFFQVDAKLVAARDAAAIGFIKNVKAIGAGVALQNYTADLQNQELIAELDINFLNITCTTESGGNYIEVSANQLRNDFAAASEANINSIAKGVQSAEMFSLLWECGAGYVQGDYIQPPGTELAEGIADEQTLSSDAPSGPSWQIAG